MPEELSEPTCRWNNHNWWKLYWTNHLKYLDVVLKPCCKWRNMHSSKITKCEIKQSVWHFSDLILLLPWFSLMNDVLWADRTSSTELYLSLLSIKVHRISLRWTATHHLSCHQLWFIEAKILISLSDRLVLLASTHPWLIVM